MVQFVSTRQTRWFHYYGCNLKNGTVICENYFAQNSFLTFGDVEAKRLTLGQVWRQWCDGEFNFLSFECRFRICTICHSSRDNGGFPKWCSPFAKKKTRKLCKFLPLEVTILTLAKNDRNSFDWVLTIFRVPLSACLCATLRSRVRWGA